jgi:hypothetical protein
MKWSITMYSTKKEWWLKYITKFRKMFDECLTERMLFPTAITLSCAPPRTRREEDSVSPWWVPSHSKGPIISEGYQSQSKHYIKRIAYNNHKIILNIKINMTFQIWTGRIKRPRPWERRYKNYIALAKLTQKPFQVQ